MGNRAGDGPGGDAGAHADDTAGTSPNARGAAARGRCLCGRYRFTCEGFPLWTAYCHCESCRRATAAPVATYVGYAKTQVRFAPEPGRFASSPRVRRAYCERCATALAYEAEFFPGEIHLFRSNFDRPEEFPATRHVLFDERERDFDVHDELPRYGGGQSAPIAFGPRPAERVLFLCTGNSARSILAEAILNLAGATRGDRRVVGHSAGSDPAGCVAPEALALLAPHAWRLDRPRSKSWDEFAGPGAPSLDWVITLCDSAAAVSCPVFPGKVARRHWSLPDPDTGAVSHAATWTSIEERVNALLDEIGARRA